MDVGSRQLLDIVPGRTAESAASWFRNQPTEWRKAIRWAVLDMSGPYQVAYDKVLPHARQVGACQIVCVRVGSFWFIGLGSVGWGSGFRVG